MGVVVLAAILAVVIDRLPTGARLTLTALLVPPALAYCLLVAVNTT